MKYAGLLFLLLPLALHAAEKEIETKKSAAQREETLDALHNKIMELSSKLQKHEALVPDVLQETDNTPQKQTERALTLVTLEIEARAIHAKPMDTQEQYDLLAKTSEQ